MPSLVYRLLATQALLALLGFGYATPVRADDDGEDEDLDDEERGAALKKRHDRDAARDDAQRVAAPPRRPGTTQRVLFVEFGSSGAGSEDVAREMSQAVLADLRSHGEIDVMDLAQVPPIYETPATVYMKGCPEGQDSGCQLVLGERADADRVVAGRVEVKQKRTRLIVTIINIANSEVEQAYAAEISGEGHDAVVQSIYLTVTRLAQPLGESGEEEEELRGRADEEAKAAQAAKEKRALEALDVALGKANFEVIDIEKKLNRPARITLKDVEAADQGESISTPWTQIGLTKVQYVSYRNSGLAVEEWKRRNSGHWLQPFVSVAGGFGSGAYGLRYYGHYLMDYELANVLDNYAYQSIDKTSGVRFEATVGFGLLPIMDFEYSLGVVGITVFRQKEDGKLDQNSGTDADPSYHLNDDWQEDDVTRISHTFKLRFYPLTVPRVRPSVAVGFSTMSYPDLFANEPADSRYLTFAPYTLRAIDIEPGVMVELGQRAGLFLHVPIWIDVNSDATRTATYDQFPNSDLLNTAFATNFGLDTGLEPVPEPSRVSVFVMVGVQIRPTPVFVPKNSRRAGRDEILDD